jgi:hypothetical protein
VLEQQLRLRKLDRARLKAVLQAVVRLVQLCVRFVKDLLHARTPSAKSGLCPGASALFPHGGTMSVAMMGAASF